MNNSLVFGLKRVVFGTKYEVTRVGTIPQASAYVFTRRAGNTVQEGWPLHAVDSERQKNAFKNFRKSLAEIHISQSMKLTQDGTLRQVVIPTPQSVRHKALDVKVESLGIYLFPNKRVKLVEPASPAQAAKPGDPEESAE